MNFDDLKSIMDAFDPSSLLPELEAVTGVLVTAMRVAVLAGPIVLLLMGLAYILVAPKEANYIFGYRCYFGMGSVEAWRYSQRIAGLVWAGLGLVLTAVVFYISNGFASQNVVEVMFSALRCILWEAGLVALSCIAINTVVMLNFTADGALRRR